MKNIVLLLVSLFITIFLSTACVEKNVKKNVEINAANSTEDAYDENYEDPNNPLNIIGMRVEWLKDKYDRDDYKITLQTKDGDYKYSDEDAEQYYDKYALVFALAACICDTQLGKDSTEDNIRDYLNNNLFGIVRDIPLNDSYPRKVREVVNKTYYDNIDDIKHTLHLADRGYGYKVYEGYKIKRYWPFPGSYIGRLYVRRGDDGILYIKNNYH